MEQTSDCIYSTPFAVDTILNSIPGADLTTDGTLHAEQICISEASETLRELHAFCKNARLSSEERLVQVLGELDCIEWDFVLFSETRTQLSDCVLRGGHRLITNFGDCNSAGVGILVHARWTRYIRKVHLVSDRVMAIDVSIAHYSARIAAVYMPHAGYGLDAIIDTYDELSHYFSNTQVQANCNCWRRFQY